MKKIAYCYDKRSKRKNSLPFPVVKITNILQVYNDDYPCIIFDYDFLKRRPKLDIDKLTNKICCIRFAQEHSSNISIVRKYGFFDFFTDNETKAKILFKIRRLKNSIESVSKIDLLNKRIDKLILVDHLTGCYNWRYFLNRAKQELSRALRHHYNISFIIIDIDYFRQINEIYGTKVADMVIKHLVVILQKLLRKEDILTRWREDEFFVTLPYLAKADAYKVATRIKSKVSAYTFCYKNISMKIKVSLGVTSAPSDKISNTGDVISYLSNCLAIAKRKGGDLVVQYLTQQPKIEHLKEKKVDTDELKRKIEKLGTLMTRDLLEMIYGFARAIEAKDHYTGKHVESTAYIAEALATELKLPRSEVENIKRAAILHDLGKVGIDDAILSKQGPLTPAEKEVIKSHPWVACEILRNIHSLRGSIPAILYHHERYDGSGYPLGLQGDEIPLGARIVALSDVYQALVSNRPYRSSFTKKKAVTIIKDESGKHFDPKIVQCFLKIIKKIDTKSAKAL